MKNKKPDDKTVKSLGWVQVSKFMRREKSMRSEEVDLAIQTISELKSYREIQSEVTH